jgi:parallel beta-helix repeat protein
MASPNLSSVHIGGFIVKNANFEGILIANTSASSVSANVVMGNNKALANAACPGIDAFETNEQDDCGEGIHLLGADHILVTGNIVQNNSGGILLSDDTAATHDNLISANSVTNNAADCGITLASHAPAASTGSAMPLGVFHNTVYGNDAEKNGTTASGGAGVGIFASIPGASAYANVVANNVLRNNGLPGIALHAHTPGQKLTDNILVANTLDGNGADTEDAATSGPTGINLFAVSPATGNIAALNTIRNEDIDISANTPALLQTQFNNLVGGKTGVANAGANTIDATWNWWGCVSGPNAGGNCTATTGPNILTTPWLPFPATLSNLSNFQIFNFLTLANF